MRNARPTTPRNVVHESEALRPRDPSQDVNECAEFVLNDAYITLESNGRPASVLQAFPDAPLRVQGRLAAPSRQDSHQLLAKPFRSTDIFVRNVTQYSYAEMDDKSYSVWALGEAGWFEIQPGPGYETVYADTIEAVRLLYFVADIYAESEPRKRGGGPSADLLYQEYAEDTRFSCSDTTEAERVFHRHHTFLFMCFLKGERDIRWSNTPLYQTLKRQFPDDFKRCKARHEGRFTDVKPERKARTSRTSPAPVATPATAGVSGSRSAKGRPDEAPKKDDNWWEAATLFEFMQKAVNQRVIRAGRNSITVDRVAQLIIKRFEVDDVATARNVLLVHARNLCYMMDHPRRQNIRFFAAEPIYGELTAGHSLSAAEQRRAEGLELRLRKDHRAMRGEDGESSDTSDEDEDVLITPKRRLPGRSKKGTLSVLRPKSGKYSGKGKHVQQSGKGKTNPSIPVSDSDADTSSDVDSDDNAMAIDTPTHGLSPGTLKRKLSLSNEARENGKRKRTRTQSTPPSPTTSSPTPEPGTADPPLPLRYHPGTTQRPTSRSKSTQPMLPALVSTPPPTYEPNGPRDSWICTFDGCAQRIYGCSKDIGRQLITEHLEDHTKGREKVVGILWREQDRLHLPVSNLIKKIREMSEASTPLFPGEAGSEMPPPVQRRG